MQNNLMRSRQFAPLFWTQFLSAFNDNFLKNTLVFLILFNMAASEAGAMVTLAGAIFMAPFLLLSALGGEMADKFDKAVMAEKLKKAEVGAACVAVAGFILSSVAVLMVALFLFGVISALFGPVKYGILPDHLPARDLPRANAWVEGGTFIAILGGTICAGIAATDGINPWLFGPAMIALAVVCWFISRFIPKGGAKAPSLQIDRNILRSTWRLVAELRKDTRIWRTAMMSAWFWLVGAIILSLLPPMVKNLMGGPEIVVTAYLAVFAVAVGVGSAIAAWMSAGRIVLLPAPVGTVLMAAFGLDLAWSVAGASTNPETATLLAFFAEDYTIRIAIDLAGLAIAGAFLVVPTFAGLQAWAHEDHRARVIAAANVLGAGFMTVGGGLVAALQAAGTSIPVLLLGLAILNAVAAWVMLKTLPTNAFRDFISILFRAFLRLEVSGLENIKKAGPAPIIALNHVSFLDGAVALALSDEEPIFAVDYTIAQAWWAKPFLKLCNFLPLDPSKPMATRTLIKAVDQGDPLVIFPEGRITVTGGLMKVYDGAAMVADKTGSKVVPVRIDGLEKSYFSRLSSKHVRRRLFPKVKVTILEPVSLPVADELKGRKRRLAAGAALYQVMSMMLFRTTDTSCTVLEKIIETANDRGFGELATQDPVTGDFSYRKLLTGVAVLADKFKTRFPDEENLGLLLPNANGSVATILGVMSAGKVPAMLNFTAGSANIISACKAAEIRTVLTSRQFVEQAKLEPVLDELAKQVNIVWLDDLRETVTSFDKIRGFVRKAKPLVKRKADDPAVILFTSGSEGTPKGVVLTHQNVLSNVAQAASRIDFNSQDKVFNILPVFHSFGLTAGTILPLTSGVPVYFYPSPLHYRVVPELVYGSNATIIFGTDTFLNGYARTAHPYDFRSIRYCFAGAEPVKPTTRAAYMEKFGVRILEGYGVTEAAPVIALNTPMFNRAGSVGKIMPGMEYRLEEVPGVDEGGRLYVRGANVMAGYLRAENPGQLETLPDGWHDTGDVVKVDEEGFVTILGRAKRFAKIGGEMVSLAAVESLAGELWPSNLSVVVSIPDERKGERLIMLTDAEQASRKDFMTFAKKKGAMEIMVPAEVRVGKVPVLGSGKVDFVAAKQVIEKGEESASAA
ncbi:acyl-[ACP]--phospholipid O-acyltransferase [Thalassospira sp. TSL5-1]|uniref:acyl-[ACP]--phospholipid O-acyltransferase n=1 Tax=Thalassospira sp. TSL5-1 TaxID=1544451 RepID=UPI00093D5EAB|nr:acyl-[ACP]--phospholipid O-acyltransferase [Thalassospira sp. TSL5-1]OKH89261.1 2-acyl-glycerophospho-ethanolamine acyltransferase [Thalassospira sp. TSL5-1]